MDLDRVKPIWCFVGNVLYAVEIELEWRGNIFEQPSPNFFYVYINPGKSKFGSYIKATRPSF